MKDFNKELNRLIKLAERSKDDPDGTSWTFRIGVLLSYNQAKEMLEALEQVEKMKEVLEEIMQKADYHKGSGETANPTLWKVIEIAEQVLNQKK